MKQDNDIRAAAVTLGRRGGLAKSDRKTAANRANARKPRPGARKARLSVQGLNRLPCSGCADFCCPARSV